MRLGLLCDILWYNMIKFIYVSVRWVTESTALLESVCDHQALAWHEKQASLFEHLSLSYFPKTLVHNCTCMRFELTNN